MVNLGYTSPAIGEDVDGGERLATAAFDEIKTAFNGRIDWVNLSPALQAQLSAGIHSDTPLVSSLPTGQPDGQPIDLLVNPTTIWPFIKVAGKWVARGRGTALRTQITSSTPWGGSSPVVFNFASSVPLRGTYEITAGAEISPMGFGYKFGVIVTSAPPAAGEDPRGSALCYVPEPAMAPGQPRVVVPSADLGPGGRLNVHFVERTPAAAPTITNPWVELVPKTLDAP